MDEVVKLDFFFFIIFVAKSVVSTTKRWNCIVLTYHKTRWYNSSHANECVVVEYEEKSLDYRPLMNVVKQCEANSPLMSTSAKVPKYILQSANRWAHVKPLARSNDQGTLMYSPDCQRENLSLMHTSLKVLIKNLSLNLDNVLMSIGQDLLEGRHYESPII